MVRQPYYWILFIVRLQPMALPSLHVKLGVGDKAYEFVFTPVI